MTPGVNSNTRGRASSLVLRRPWQIARRNHANHMTWSRTKSTTPNFVIYVRPVQPKLDAERTAGKVRKDFDN